MDPSSPNNETPESLRQKRLAKLAAASTSPAASSSAQAEPTTVLSAGPSVKKAAVAKESGPSTPNALKLQSTASPTPSATATPTTATTPSGTDRLVSQFLSFADSDWEGQTFEFIFQVSFNVDVALRKSYMYIPSLIEELQSESIPLVFTHDLVERVLYARLLTPAADDAPLIDYIIGCWKRIAEVKRRATIVVDRANGETRKQVQEVAARRVGYVTAAKALIMNYSWLVMMPGMADSFAQPARVAEVASGLLAEKLLLPNPDESESQLPPEFLEDFVARYENDEFLEILGPIFSSVSAKMLKGSIEQHEQIPLQALIRLLSFKSVAAAVTQLPQFNPQDTPPRLVEVATTLGPFLSRLTTFPDSDQSIVTKYFSSSNPLAYGMEPGTNYIGFDVGMRNYGDLQSTMGSLRGISARTKSSLGGVFLTIIRSSAEAKEAILQFSADAVSKNIARGKLQVDPRTVSTNGFMHNLRSVFLQLADPIMDPKFSKVHLIDPHYFKHSQRLACVVDEQTRINSDKISADAYFQEWRAENPTPAAANFVSEVFYLALAFHHYGSLSIIRTYGSFLKEVEEMRKQIDRMRAEKERLGAQWTPMNEELFKRYLVQLDTYIGYKLAMDVALLDPIEIEHSLRFFNLVIVWLIRIIVVGIGAIHANGSKPDSIQWDRVIRGDLQGLPLFPLPAEAPKLFTTLPEWIIEDICDYYLFVCRNNLIVLETFPRDGICAFAMLILQNSGYIKNPYLKSKLVEIMFFFTVPLYRNAAGEVVKRLDDVFGTHPLMREHLVQAVMSFYIDVEQTGMASQFYDKFNIRYNISHILKCVWNDPTHRTNVIKESMRLESFVKFANLLMNDTRYLLDEGLDKMTEIRTIENEMADASTWMSGTQQHRQEREATFRMAERQAYSYMSLGNETVHMLNYMTTNDRICIPFMQPEIVERLAAMLDYNLAALVGPRCTELKVRNPEKYSFRPKSLLNDLIGIYLNLARRKEFQVAISKDGRSYKKEHFHRAADILVKSSLRNEGELSALRDFVDTVEALIKAEADAEQEYGEAPDEFLDPLMFTLMEDPVILPTSHVTVDRSTIKSHLLSDQHDPFNRMPLTIDMVVPNDELKQQIYEWKRSKRAAKDDPMEF
ncbi:ubiquitin elongating factor core-domain-containing protein [Polychytrium aggregatum]|uniref:ubiquitin elongating factor core-domain-containing protein n=1 Tax=Polychytrium aggregatum TaxID=110093 RepID=UPI0022FE0C23|nr:ubiquitin elongating factor core-domain-containing protein [Polychytrium aggregatum]KAI9209353.1 ubiquitin elongating factor core-domain-containing protein [Polychytrium aggregatum]